MSHVEQSRAAHRRLRTHDECPVCGCASIRRDDLDEQRGYVMATCRRCGHGWDECWAEAPRALASSATAFIADGEQWREIGGIKSIELTTTDHEPAAPLQLIAVREHFSMSVRLKRRQARRLLRIIGWQSPPIPAKAAHRRRYSRG